LLALLVGAVGGLFASVIATATSNGWRMNGAPSRVESTANHLTALPGGRVRFYATRSRDRGRRWAQPTLIGRGLDLALQDAELSTPIRSGTTQFLSAATGPNGRVGVAWSAVSAPETSRIMLAMSDDAGRTWSRPRSISTGADRPLNPDLAIAGNGAVAVRFFDLRADRAGDQALSTQSWLRASPDGRHAWQERRIGGVFDLRTAPVVPSGTPGRFLGEYQGLVGQAGGLAALFAQAQPQARTGPTDGFFTRVRLAGAG
jgi:hypothetical protein